MTSFTTLYFTVFINLLFSFVKFIFTDAIETVFNTTKSSILRKRALEGFQHYATVAAYYGLQEHFDRLLILLCRQFVTLARDQGALYRAAQNAEVSKYKSEGASIAYMESTVVDISIPPPSFIPVSLALSRSPLF